MIKQGNIYKEKNPPYYRHDEGNFVITSQMFTTCWILYQTGETDRVSIDWVKKDCVLVKECASWREAINDEAFK